MADRTPLLILTHLQTDRGRTFSDALQRQLLDCYQTHRWFPCVLDLARCEPSALVTDGPRTLVLDCDITEYHTQCSRLEISEDEVAILLTNSPCPTLAHIPTLAPHPALTGALLADRMLRRGDSEYWLVAQTVTPAHQIALDAFVTELGYAGRAPDSFHTHLSSATAFAPDDISRTAQVALLDAHCAEAFGRAFPSAALTDFPRQARATQPQLTRHAASTARLLIQMLAANPRRSRWLPLDAGSAPPKMATDDALVNEASDLIDARLAEPQLGPAILADELQIPRRTLERRFRSAMQNSLLQEIQRRKILAAKLYLTGVERSSERAAQNCGFKDSRMLNLAFQRFMNISPRNFLEKFDRVITR